MKSILACVAFCSATGALGQNLVPNPSFEEIASCPTCIGFQTNCTPTSWHSWFNTPDYFNACADGSVEPMDSLWDVPQNGDGYQAAFDGQAYVGLYAYGLGFDDYREIIGVELNEPLVVGQAYTASMRVNLAIFGSYWLMRWACNNLGMRFTVGHPPYWVNGIGPPYFLPGQAQVYTQQVLTDTMGWTLIQGTFIADAPYDCLGIGNFFTDAQTDTLQVGGSLSQGAFYFVDAVTVCPAGSNCDLNTSALHEVEPAKNLWLMTTADQVHFASSQHRAAHVQIRDLTGRSVWQSSSSNGAGSVQVSDLAVGVYVFILEQGGEIVSKRFFVAH